MTYATLEQRLEAREAVAHPGKFEGEPPIVPILWAIAMDGFADSEDGPYFQIGRWIVWEGDTGFVYASRFASADDAAEGLAMVSEDGSAD